MNYLSSLEIADRWGISERSVRNYCSQDRVPGAIRIGKKWLIPKTTQKLERKK